jgi:lipopolysaccharide transport system ATP-binding protein
MNKSIIVENISKVYQLGEYGSGTLTHDLQRWWAMFRGKEDPLLKVGEDYNKYSNKNYSWSLKDLSFEINSGDAIGIIGKNGAGKSTLLKILSQVTSPTSGCVKMKGRVASLLEVGTGFHPELTGRENIYLNGAILGMRKFEITKKLDEIIDFSGVEKYIDTPVKRYSSGMYVRLAFAVAAHLESEILIVDEVLAVGDAEFQNKCLGKMDSVSKADGRTILFVSHNMSSIRKLCTSAILLDNGKLSYQGNVNEAVGIYLNTNSISTFDSLNSKLSSLKYLDGFSFKKISILQNGKFISNYFNISDNIEIQMEYEITKCLNKFRIRLEIFSSTGEFLFNTFHDNHETISTTIQAGTYKSICTIPNKLFSPKKYYIKFGATIFGQNHDNEFLLEELTYDFTGENPIWNNGYVYNEDFYGPLAPNINWINSKSTV